jgi:hypothetical protein
MTGKNACPTFQDVQNTSILYSLTTLALRTGLLVTLFLSAWMVYSKLPQQQTSSTQVVKGETILQIVLLQPQDAEAEPLDIQVELYPVDIVAVRHEYFTERRAGKRFDDFLSERMKGRKPITARLDKHGQASVAISPGNWWLHALLSGEEVLEWRLPINIAGRKQIVELTSQNVYTRTRSF